MPKPYSLDLRERVVDYVEAGHSRRAAAAHFRVSPSFVINLMTAFRERGAVAPKALGGWRHSKLDPHRVFILRRVAEKDDISMPELAGELHAASGVKADPASLSRWIIRNGLSFKKSLQASECDRPDVRQAREAWKAERQPKMRTEPHRLVFIDEAGTILRQAQDEDDPRARTLRQGRAPSLQGPLWPLEDPDFRRRTALRRPDCALGHRRADGSGDLRHLRAHPTRPDPRKRRHRHPRQPARPQKPCCRTSHPRTRRLAHVSAALQPRPQSDRNGLRQTQGAPARHGHAHHRRTLERHRPNLRSLHPTRMRKLLPSRRLWIHMTVRCSRWPLARGMARALPADGPLRTRRRRHSRNRPGSEPKRLRAGRDEDRARTPVSEWRARYSAGQSRGNLSRRDTPVV